MGGSCRSIDIRLEVSPIERALMTLAPTSNAVRKYGAAKDTQEERAKVRSRLAC